MWLNVNGIEQPYISYINNQLRTKKGTPDKVTKLMILHHRRCTATLLVAVHLCTPTPRANPWTHLELRQLNGSLVLGQDQPRERCQSPHDFLYQIHLFTRPVPGRIFFSKWREIPGQIRRNTGSWQASGQHPLFWRICAEGKSIAAERWHLMFQPTLHPLGSDVWPSNHPKIAMNLL